jgi:lysophospholipase L1-like esterase
MATHQARRRRTAFAGGLAILALCLSFTASPATAAAPPLPDYVALGDSYTAGTGAGDLYAPTPPGCWQSKGGYVDLVAATGQVTLLANLACHGALLVPGGPFYNGAPSVVQQILSRTGRSALAKAELVSITAGAIDAGSLLALRDCATPDTATCAATVAGIRAKLPAITVGLAGTYALLRASAPQAAIAVMGYPRLFDPTRGPLVLPGVTVVPVENQVQVNAAVDALNKAIADAVKLSRTKAVFVDVTQRFLGHAVNSPEPWIVLAPPVPPSTLLPDANFHPNAAGHQAYAAALLSSVVPAQPVYP